MQISIMEQSNSETGQTGYSVAFVTQNKKKVINETDFFEEGSDIGQKVIQLKRLLKIYFDSQV